MKKTYNPIKEYTSMRLRENAKISHRYIKTHFKYDSEIIPEDEDLDVGFNTEKINKLISEILNYSPFDLISVSEDDKSITYHFVGEYDPEEWQ